MRQRTPSEIKAYGDGYDEAYRQFCHLLDRHEKETAVRKMKIFADAVALTVETATDTADTPQTDCNTNQCVQRVEYVGNDEKSRCWTCKHFERMHETPISSDGSYCIYVVCTAKECNYEPKGEPQTDCGWK